ncbi:transaldolase [Quadrisphaera sp. DSM 44207]|uniref:transaldolase n=1 Tax=Quadrisphaera sp. DSM 44207 TaxID=1881057 RepID=UPI00087FF647|nr:transaldolase [Quadrisphaera sp. DSM 44207]SDQ44163.1 transaldolase [Quadrisphaera sp. DSM 44207]
MSNPALTALSQAGVSIWLDDLSRELTDSGALQQLIDDKNVVGVTSNPTIFASALAKGDRYTEQLAEVAARGGDLEQVVEQAVLEVTTTDVRRACDIFAPVYEASGGQDGRVSLEVDPRLAHDRRATEEAARTLWRTVDRPNLMIKIPAVEDGLPAITTALAEGISVNVTLIFSLDRYRAVMNAHLTGLEQAREKGLDLSRIQSVASFFVSRVDTDVDARLNEIGTEEALALRGKAALANARLAFQAYEEVLASPRWQVLADAGATPQRPLWASTGVKNPDYPDTLYVSELVTDGVVNTMPGSTLEAFADHGEVRGDTVRGTYEEASQVLDALARLGISYSEVVEGLEREAVSKFEKSWGELTGTVRDELERAAIQAGGDR